MIQPGVGEGLEFFLGKPDAGRDQIGVKAHAARGGDKLRQIFTHQRLAAGKPELHRAHGTRLAKHINPLLCRQLILLGCEIERV